MSRQLPEDAPAKPGRNKYRQAQKVVDQYYRQLVGKVADEVLIRRDSFGQVAFSAAEGLVDNFARQLSHACIVREHLARRAAEMEEGTPPGTRLHEIVCPADEVESQVNAWLEAHPDCLPISLATLPGLKEVRCHILYRRTSGGTS